MNAPRIVRITVRGRLSERIESMFDGLAISRSDGRTQLVGAIADQAQLHGQLARIRDLGLELESVQLVDANEPGDPGDPGVAP